MDDNNSITVPWMEEALAEVQNTMKKFMNDEDDDKENNNTTSIVVVGSSDVGKKYKNKNKNKRINDIIVNGGDDDDATTIRVDECFIQQLEYELSMEREMRELDKNMYLREINKRGQMIDYLEQKMKQIEMERKESQQERQDYEQKIKTKRYEIEQLYREIQLQQMEQESYKMRHDLSQQEVENTTHQYNEAQKIIGNLRSMCRKFSEQSTARSEQVEQVRVEVNLERQELEQEIQRLNQCLNNQRNSIDFLEKRVRDLLTTNERMEAQTTRTSFAAGRNLLKVNEQRTYPSSLPPVDHVHESWADGILQIFGAGGTADDITGKNDKPLNGIHEDSPDKEIEDCKWDDNMDLDTLRVLAARRVAEILATAEGKKSRLQFRHNYDSDEDTLTLSTSGETASTMYDNSECSHSIGDDDLSSISSSTKSQSSTNKTASSSNRRSSTKGQGRNSFLLKRYSLEQWDLLAGKMKSLKTKPSPWDFVRAFVFDGLEEECSEIFCEDLNATFKLRMNEE